MNRNLAFIKNLAARLAKEWVEDGNREAIFDLREMSGPEGAVFAMEMTRHLMQRDARMAFTFVAAVEEMV